ncbi:RES family NAD+ phosphorylase [Candidatus Mycobacterium methanotrophicum]|uniref:RES family NAD+ phosphorylase n=1 Tax=Candidatus Mycobacterium methanotrophicum TaxID=2943498 RepID=UPI001C58CC48|nr:RES family NAD+ phosphorylase [Candidatus Mycobacterium methanotrophicum]
MKGPPTPFKPAIECLPSGHLLYRVFTAARKPTEFNPGVGAPTRFGFFGQPVVPIMYTADNETAAVAETLLHDIPVEGGLLPYDNYSRKALARLKDTRELRLAVLHGIDLRRLKVGPEDVTSSPASTYANTVHWAKAAHGIGLDGMVWMSRLCNNTKSYAFFGDRCADAFTQDTSHARIFASPADQTWLIDLCAPLHVDVLLQAR